MEWLGKAKVEFAHSPSPRELIEKDGKKTDILKVVEDVTPPCQLNPLLFNGHLQTMWTATKPHGPKVWYRRKLFTAEDKAYEGTFAVDFVVPEHDETDPTLMSRTVYYSDEQWDNIGSQDSKPMLIILHGLSGGSHEIYLRHAIYPLIESGKWELCVVNSRGCARSKITTGILYNARATWDIRQVVKWARKTFPNRPLYGLGFSLGANMLTTYCGEEGSDCLLSGAAIVSNPFNLEVCSRMMQSTLVGKEIYLRVLGTAMKQLIRTHEKEIKNFTNLDYDAIQNITYLNEFDRQVQCPAWGYPTETAYYRDASSSDAVLSIQIPFLAIHALDDPVRLYHHTMAIGSDRRFRANVKQVAIKEGIPFEEFKQNPNTTLLTTSLGGHLCWFQSDGGRWYAKPLTGFLNHLAFEVEPDSLGPLKDADAAKMGTNKVNYNPMRRKMTPIIGP